MGYPIAHQGRSDVIWFLALLYPNGGGRGPRVLRTIPARRHGYYAIASTGSRWAMCGPSDPRPGVSV